MNEVDIASFTEALVDREVAGGKPVQFGAPQPSTAPDISDVEIPDNFTNQILSEGKWDKADVVISSPVEKPEEPPQSTIRLNEDSLYQKHLLNEYKKRVADLEELVQEMTTVGMIGVGSGAVAAPGMSVSKKQKKKKKRYARTR